MSWAKLDDCFDTHPKTLEVGLAANGLQARALAWCARHNTDGRLPESWVHQQLAQEGLQGLEERLVDAGVWERNGDGLIVHDYLEYNPSAADIEARREAERVRKERERNGGRDATDGRRRGRSRSRGPVRKESGRT